MSLPDSSSQATVVGVGAKNVPFTFSSSNKETIVGIIGTYNPAKTSVVDEIPLEVLSAGDVGEQTGYGYMLHRLAINVFAGLNGTGRVFIIPQAETGGAAATVKQIAWVGAATTKPGTIYLRLGGKLYAVAVPSGTTLEDYSQLVVDAVNADPDAPVIATKTAVTFETVFTSKSKGPWGDLLTVTLNAKQGEALPTGITSGTVSTTTPGTGTPTASDALDGMGTDDDANSIDITHLVHGYNLDTTTIDAISAYVGNGNDFTGCYSKLVGRPFVCLNGDTTAGTAGYNALLALAAARTEDRTNGYLGAPDESRHPDEIAALSIGKIGDVFQTNPIQHYAGISLFGSDADSSDRWTKNYSARDAAVKNGVSPTRVVNGILKLQNVVTSYSYGVTPASNGYKSFRSFAITRNILKFMRELFEADAWQGCAIVENIEDVTDLEASQKVRDVNSVKTALNNLTDFLVGKGMLFEGDFTKENSTVAIRALSNGFDINYKYKISGELQVFNIQQSFDTNIAS
ncbi:MAG: hypothetical protein P8X74_03605 [Reinekea sp.]